MDNYHVTQLTSSGGGHGSSGTVGPLFVVLAIIMVLGVVAGFIGRVCAGRHWGGDTQYDFEGWVEKRCASCIDGDIEAPPPPPPPPEKPREEAPAPAADAAPPPPADAAAPPPADGAPQPATDAAPPAGEAAAAPAADGAVAPPAEAPPATPPPAEAAPPPPAEPIPPPPPPPPPPDDAGGARPVRMDPITYMHLYPSYSCRCHICAREGIFD
ncbi:hypothetical protein L7F22_018443 [Adiantum nelumboides]|nr:hypothetical protein [Adiantum nelumboides]